MGSGSSKGGGNVIGWGLVDGASGLKDVVQVGTGYRQSLALANNIVYSWGSGFYGVLGHGSFNDKSKPTAIQGLPPIEQISCRYHHCLALSRDGKIYNWGENCIDQAGAERTLSKPSVVPLPTSKPVNHIYCSDKYAAFTTEDGEVFFWGSLPVHTAVSPGPLPAFQNIGVKQVACAKHYFIALSDQGDIYEWGNPPSGISNVARLVPNFDETTEQPRKYTQIACGGDHSLALTDDGFVYSWGINEFGQLGHGDRTTRKNPLNISALNRKDVINIYCGITTSFAVTGYGDAFSWGSNKHGQLGYYEPSVQLRPRLVDGLARTSIKHITGSDVHTLAVIGSPQKVRILPLADLCARKIAIKADYFTDLIQGLPSLPDSVAQKLLAWLVDMDKLEPATLRLFRRSIITELNLSHNPAVTDDCLRIIAQFKSLKALDLSWCRSMTLQGLEVLKQLPNLKVLLVDGCTNFSIEEFKTKWKDSVISHM